MKSKILDEELLSELLNLGVDIDQPILHDLVQKFKTDVSKHLQNLRKFSSEKKFAELEELAHSLKGSAGTIGALCVRVICQNIEQHAENKYTVSETEFAELEDEVKMAIHFLECFLLETSGKIAA